MPEKRSRIDCLSEDSKKSLSHQPESEDKGSSKIDMWESPPQLVSLFFLNILDNYCMVKLLRPVEIEFYFRYYELECSLIHTNKNIFQESLDV